MEEEKNEEEVNNILENNRVSTDKSATNKEETVIVDEERRRIDVDTLLAYNKEDSAVQGINYLLSLDTKCIDRQFIVDLFNQKAGNVVDEATALEVLKDVHKDAVEHINKNDEFLYIDTTTGRVDTKRSKEKAMENSEHTPQKSKLEDVLDRSIEKYLDKDSNKKLKEDKIEEKVLQFFETEEHRQIKKDEIDRFFFENPENEEDIENLNNTEVKEELIGKELYGKYELAIANINEHINNYSSKYSEFEIKLLEFDTNLRNARNTSKFGEILAKRTEFLEQHPELEEYIDKETGLVGEDVYINYKNDVEQYNDSLITATLIKQINIINGIGFDNLDFTHKKNAIMHLIAGLKIEGIKDDVSKFLEQIVPGYKHSDDINNKDNRIALEAIMRYNGILQKEGFEELIETGYKSLLDKIDERSFVNNNEKMIRDDDIQEFMEMYSQEMNVEQIVIEKTGTEEDKYFYGSKIKFSKEDNEAFRYLYKKATIYTWITDKNRAMLQRYACLLNSKDELEQSNLDSEIVQERLDQVNKEIKEFEKKHADLKYKLILDEEGKLIPDVKKSVQDYTQLRSISKLTEDFIEDENKVNNFKDYARLPNSEKEKYLRNTIAALNQIDIENHQIKSKDIKGILSKMANRRLEVMNNNKTTFITINSQDDIQIDTDAILKEYNRISPYKFNSYEKLLEYCELNKLEYVNSKMQYIENMDESAFYTLDGARSDDDKLKKIEETKLINYKTNFFGNFSESLTGRLTQESIDSLELSDELKERLNTLEQKINSEDVVLMEFKRLQDLIDSTHGENQNENIRKRDELIRNNPDKGKAFLHVINNPSEYANRLNQYNNEIVAKNTLLTMATINKLSEKDLQLFVENPVERRKALLTLLGALDGAIEDKLDELACAIQKLCPDSRIIDEEGNLVTDFEILSPMIGKHLGIENANELDLGGLIFKSKAIVLENDNNRRLNNQQVKDINQALDVYEVLDYDINIDDITRNREEIYFKNSYMDYSEEDKTNFENLYYKTLSKSWIETKDDAEKYRYMYWLKKQMTIKNSNDITPESLEMIEKKLQEIEEACPNLKREDFVENGKLKPEYEEQINEYSNMKFLGDLISDYVLDESKVESSIDYRRLPRNQKLNYLIKSYLGLSEKNDDSGIINKVAKRRLEIISSSDKKFVKEDKDNNLTINEKAFCEEYSRVAGREVKSFDELNYLYRHYRNSYIRVKLNTYARKLDAEDFVEIGEGTDKERAIRVEKAKAKNNLIRSLAAIEGRNLKDRNQIPEKSEDRYRDGSQKTNIQSERTINTDSSHNNQTISDIPDRFETGNGMKISEIKIENISVEHNAVESKDEQNELAVIETSKGFFGKIVDKIKSLFQKDEKNTESKQEMPKSNELEASNDFNKRIQCDGKVEEALKVTRENADKKANGLEEITQSDYDDRVGV